MNCFTHLLQFVISVEYHSSRHPLYEFTEEER